MAKLVHYPQLSAIVDAARRCALASEDETAESAGQELASSVSNLLESVSHVDSETEDGVYDCLRAVHAMLDPSNVACEGHSEILAERAGWELFQIFTSPLYERLTPRCHEACGRISLAISRFGNARELYTILVEGIQRTLESAISAQEGEELKGQPWLQLLYLLNCFSIVLSRIPRRVDHFFAEAQRLLVSVGEVAAQEETENLFFSGSEAEKIVKDTVGETVQKVFGALVDIAKVATDSCARVEGEQKLRLEKVVKVYALQLMVAGKDVWQGLPAEGGDDTMEELLKLVSCLRDCHVNVYSLLQNGHHCLLQDLRELFADGSEDLEDEKVAEMRWKKGEEMVLQGACLTVAHALTNPLVLNAFPRKLPTSSDSDPTGSLYKDAILTPTEALNALQMASTLLRSPGLSVKGLYLVEAVIEQTRPDERSSSLDLAVTAIPTLQALQHALLQSPAPLGKRYFSALQKVLKNSLTPQARMDALEALIASCPNPMLVSLLLMVAKDEVAQEWSQVTSSDSNGSPKSGGKSMEGMAFVNPRILHLVENILQPSNKDPLKISEEADAVLGALNVYRFLLLREAAGSTNYTGCRTPENLSKARNKWLLPLRHVAGNIISGLEGNRNDEVDEAIMMSVQAVLSVVHRCLEIVEDEINRSRKRDQSVL